MTPDTATPDPATISRFQDDCAAALRRRVEPDDIFAVAVSGGPDSMALLAMAAAAWPGQIIAATVDHGLRADAADEARMVSDFCAGLASPGSRDAPVRHTTLTPATPLGTANVQATAREARYGLLVEWARAADATILATAHHADDQAETFLMRAARGSGLAGLAGIRPHQRIGNGIALIRPLLDWRRAELRALAITLKLPFVDDPSNASDVYDRTHFRSMLASTPWLDVAKIARSASHLAETDADLRALEAWLIEARSLPAKSGQRRIDVTGLPREIRRRLARAIITALREELAILTPPWTQASNVESLLDALEAGRGASQAGIMASAGADIWRFSAAPPRRDT